MIFKKKLYRLNFEILASLYYLGSLESHERLIVFLVVKSGNCVFVNIITFIIYFLNETEVFISYLLNIVYCRINYLLKKSLDNLCLIIINIHSFNIFQSFAFDQCFWSFNENHHHYASQAVVFNSLGADILDNAFQGYNACILAYGQTGQLSKFEFVLNSLINSYNLFNMTFQTLIYSDINKIMLLILLFNPQTINMITQK